MADSSSLEALFSKGGLTKEACLTGSRTIAEALHKRIVIFDDGMSDTVAAYAVGFAIFVGGWIVSILVEYMLWYLLMFNWRRLCCGRKVNGKDAWNKKYNDHDESANREKHLPVPSQQQQQPLVVTSSVTGSAPYGVAVSTSHPQLRQVNYAHRGIGGRTGETLGTEPTQFKSVPVVQATDSNRWHGHQRTRYESYVRLIVLSMRVFIVVAGIVFGFRAAGVNILSLAASLGIISICFSYGAAPMLHNVLSALYMYGTDKLEMGDYVRVGMYYGVVSALRAQWLEIIDDLHPMQGRQVHQVPNKVPMDTIVTVFPNGPPPEMIQTYFTELATLNKWRADVMHLDPIPPISFCMQ